MITIKKTKDLTGRGQVAVIATALKNGKKNSRAVKSSWAYSVATAKVAGTWDSMVAGLIVTETLDMEGV